MLCYVFLHHFLSIFLGFRFWFWVFTAMPGWGSCPSAPPRWGSDMPGWGCCPICPPLATPLVLRVCHIILEAIKAEFKARHSVEITIDRTKSNLRTIFFS